jgi:hypothetical protein
MTNEKCKCFLCGGEAIKKGEMEIPTSNKEMTVIPFDCSNCGKFSIEHYCYTGNSNGTVYFGHYKNEKNNGMFIHKSNIQKMSQEEFISRAMIVAARRKSKGIDDYILGDEDKILELNRQKQKYVFIGLHSFLDLYND